MAHMGGAATAHLTRGLHHGIQTVLRVPGDQVAKLHLPVLWAGFPGKKPKSSMKKEDVPEKI